MASQIGRPRVSAGLPHLPRPTRGQIVWWVIGGVVAVAAVVSVAVTGASGSAQSNEGAGPAEHYPVSASEPVALPLAA